VCDILAIIICGGWPFYVGLGFLTFGLNGKYGDDKMVPVDDFRDLGSACTITDIDYIGYRTKNSNNLWCGDSCGDDTSEHGEGDYDCYDQYDYQFTWNEATNPQAKFKSSTEDIKRHDGECKKNSLGDAVSANFQQGQVTECWKPRGSKPFEDGAHVEALGYLCGNPGCMKVLDPHKEAAENDGKHNQRILIGAVLLVVGCLIWGWWHYHVKPAFERSRNTDGPGGTHLYRDSDV
jgi:hypothetical protein